MPERVVIGTRGSRLALIQTGIVRELLENEGYEVDIKVIRTSGDLFEGRPLREFRGVGAFVREIDLRVSKGEVDIAVHSMKDIPTKTAEGTVITAVLPRESPCDVLVTKNGDLESLKNNAVVGTSSMRRAAQIRRYRRDLKVKDIRGNVDTRLRKLSEGEYDAIMLAEAGLKRLGLDVNYTVLDPERFVPSANQGIIAVVSSKNNAEAFRWMNDERTYVEGMVERIIVGEIGAGCTVPVGVLARMYRKEIDIRAEILSPDGKLAIRLERKIGKEDYKERARKIGVELREKGGGELIERTISG